MRYVIKKNKAALYYLENTDIDINAKNTQGANALHLALENKNEAMALRLLGKGIEIGSHTVEKYKQGGNTMLHLALKYNCLNVAREILRKQPNLVNEKNDLGKTPIEMVTGLTGKKHELLPLMELLSYQQKIKLRADDSYKLASFCGIFRFFGFNYSAGQKKGAVEKLIKVYLDGEDASCLKDHKGALNNGRLKEINKNLKRTRP